MNKKRVLISLLDEGGEQLARLLSQEVARVGYEPVAHGWVDDLAKAAWVPVLNELVSCHVWIIAGQTARFAEKATRQGLALTALGAQSALGRDLPILLSPSAGVLDVANLPTPLRGAESVNAGLGARVAVRGAVPGKPVERLYRCRPHGMGSLGLWFEVGPVREPWAGAFLGTVGDVQADGTPLAPTAHGVGPEGTVPAASTLHYPVQGLQMTMNDETFTAWGLANALSPAESYFVRVGATPDALLFGPFPDADDPEVFSLRLV